MRTTYTCIWLTISILAVSLAWYADQACSAPCAVSCTATICLQKKTGDTVQCLHYRYFYGEMNHPGSPANCNSVPITYAMRPSVCSASCSDWNGATLRKAPDCANSNEDTVDVDGCQTCYGSGT